jgi:hypothetical protein
MTQRLASALKARSVVNIASDSPVLCFVESDPGNGWRPKPKPGTTLTRGWIWHHMQLAQERAGLEVNGKVHVLRHTYGMRLATAGAPLQSIKELMGHQDIATTMRYMHLAGGSTAHAVALLDQGTPGARQTEQNGNG